MAPGRGPARVLPFGLGAVHDCPETDSSGPWETLKLRNLLCRTRLLGVGFFFFFDDAGSVS